MYKENPKLAGSGLVAAIPQKGICPVGCADCFFQSGRSYLEPLEDNLPNMPSVEYADGKVVRINDGNDSNNQRQLVIDAASVYKHKFFNTSIPVGLNDFPAPVVLTINPGKLTDVRFHEICDSDAENIMFVRFRVNAWNLGLCDQAVMFYTTLKVPVVLTFMAYYELDIPEQHRGVYEFKKRTLNSYWVMKPDMWRAVMERYADNSLVYSCGKDAKTYQCARCGNCLREYFACEQRRKA